MKSKAVLCLTCLFIFFSGKSQTVVVNPDGTHSTITDNGATKTIVNPNGTHSTVIDNGSTKTIINPNGTHTLVVGGGNTKTIIHPNGAHSLLTKNESVVISRTSKVNSWALWYLVFSGIKF